ncbi:tRNA 2-thiouridine(34) synthase MnmA [bacterium]|jgi:tRNA-uridine 2-sulfurtransferase|nr:tRNA 2-thiouridine(34) synthase MnmA [bacterium]MBT3580856.1 tRNA 2-thiouridine(34) synthase MnmA [bacterium]MBT4552422.1 tRNA 2-thiouridine(34) synthase MnmA [bacterium]MBT7088039.1 tRNA 2-thiouridine(34) synthase MnmA [bacterium]
MKQRVSRQTLVKEIYMKIAVGLSGGVDSSTAAAILKKQGHSVIGLTMKVWDISYQGTGVKSACFGPDEKDDIKDAQKIAELLDIPYHVLDLSQEYKANILSYFKAEYLAGRTPNPCVKCNKLIKFGALLDKARNSGIDFNYFATGHYARVEKQEDRYLLKTAKYDLKDQSYFLVFLSQEQLAQVIFPLGGYQKAEVRNIAAEFNLPTHDKKESQDFYSGDYTELLDSLPPQGDIVNKKGIVLGKHKGICHYTIGQRKGLGISSASPLYVISIDRAQNQIIVGEETELYHNSLIASSLNWISVKKVETPIQIKAKIRYRQEAEPAQIIPLKNDLVRVEFARPQKAITPGQVIAFYQEENVLGGGIIQEAH